MKDSVQYYISAPTQRTPGHWVISILFLSLFRRQFRRHGARGDTASAIGHGVGQLNDSDVHKSESSVDSRAALVVGLLLSNGTVLYSSKPTMW